jgi:hypothetical protein
MKAVTKPPAPALPQPVTIDRRRESSTTPLLPKPLPERRATATAETFAPDSTTLDPHARLVDHSPRDGQMTKIELLEKLRRHIQLAAAEELVGTAWTVEHCPWFEYWFAYYEARGAREVEAALRKYAPEAAAAATAADYIAPVVARVRSAVQRWRATGEVDAPAAAMPASIEIMTSLGPGEPLASSVRSRMEHAIGGSLADTRVHTNALGARVASEQGARAFAVGSHVAFGAATYAPGTLAGDAILAHELAHTQQQRGSGATSSGQTRSLERAADRSAANMLARLWTRTRDFAASPVARTGLQLQRCRADNAEVEVPAFAADVAPNIADVPDLDTAAKELGQRIDITTWKPPESDALLFIEGTLEGSKEKHLFILPAAQYVVAPPDPNRPTTARTIDPTRKPAMWMPAAAHAAVHLVNAGGTSGLMIDVAGTRNGQGDPSVLLSQNLQRLRTQFGITSVDHALVSHLHSDHVGALAWMIANGSISGRNVWVLPGIEASTVGPLADQVNQIGRRQLLPAGWAPQPLTTRTIANNTVTRSTLSVGTATVEMAVETRHLQAFVNALAAGDWRRATALADAATPVIRVRWDNGLDAVITGDIRGNTIGQLHQAMGEQAFRELVGNARIWIGAHHIGAIGDQPQARGFLRLIEAMGGGTQPITLVAQVGPNHEVNRQYIRVANESGVRVVIVGVPDQANPNATITIRSGGTVVHVGGQDFGIHPAVRDAQKRIETLKRATSALERLPEYRGVEGMTKQQVLDAFRAETTRLEQGIRERAAIAHGEAHLENFTDATQQRLRTNETALKRVEGLEQTAPDAVRRLSRAPKEINELAREQRLARSVGATSARLRQLLAQVDPTIARDIMVNELGKAKNRSTTRRAWAHIEARLETQLETQRMMQPINFGARAKAGGYFGLALQAAELATPGVEQYFKSKSDQRHEDFYMFYRDAVWWYEKGLQPPLLGTTEDGPSTSLGPSIERRLYEDTPKAQRGPMSAEATAAKPLETLVVPELSQWDAGQRLAFFDSVRSWASAHINDMEDYFAEMRTGPVAPIRVKPSSSKIPFDKETWQLHIGVIRDGHVHPAWQDSDELSKIMNATMVRAHLGIDAVIQQRLKEPRARPQSNTTWDQQAQDRPNRGGIDPKIGIVGEVKVIKDGAKIYGARGNTKGELEPVYLEATADTDTGLQLLELDRNAPDGYVWVAPAESFTYYILRGLKGWHFARAVEIPIFYPNRDPASPDFDKPVDQESKMSPEELEAWQGHVAQREGYIFTEYPNPDNTRTYRGKVTIFEKGSNPGAIVLMRRKDIGPK